MKTINILAGDTLEGASMGDTVINLWGDKGVIVDEVGATWRIKSTKYGRITPVFKYNPDRAVIVGVEK